MQTPLTRPLTLTNIEVADCSLEESAEDLIDTLYRIRIELMNTRLELRVALESV